MDYTARMYDPSLGRFAQADTLVPAGAQGLDRYAYVNNNPVRYTDPSGHMLDDGCRTSGCATDMEKIDWRLRIILGKSKPGDVLQTRLKNGNNMEFVFAHDPNGALILWNMDEGRGWDGISALQYLTQHATDAGLFQMNNTDGSYSLVRDRHNFIGNLDSTALPYPIQSHMNAQIGMQPGSPDPGSNLPPGFDNGDLFFEKERGDPCGLFWLLLSVSTQRTAPLPGPLTPIVSALFAYNGIEELYGQFHTWTIVDVTYNPGINQPYNPLIP